MAKYELALVINAKIDKDTRVATLKKAQGYIERFGGTLGATEEWGKKRLAYEIQKMHEGYYYFVRFESDTNCPNELEQNMRIMDNVLRYLIFRIDDEAEIGEPNETDLKEIQEEIAKEEEAAEETPADVAVDVEEAAPAEAAVAEEAPAAEAPVEEAPTEEAPSEEAPAEEAPAEEAPAEEAPAEEDADKE